MLGEAVTVGRWCGVDVRDAWPEHDDIDWPNTFNNRVEKVWERFVKRQERESARNTYMASWPCKPVRNEVP